MRFKHLLMAICIVFFMNACGYKPSSVYAKKEISGNVYVNLVMNVEDARNTVIIKDAMNELLVHRLGVNLVDSKALADVIVNVKLNSVSMSTLQYDEQGYNKLYRATVSVKVDYMKKATREKKSFSVSGVYDFSIDNGTTITDTKRFEAIKSAVSKALEEMISKIAVNSFKKAKVEDKEETED